MIASTVTWATGVIEAGVDERCNCGLCAGATTLMAIPEASRRRDHDLSTLIRRLRSDRSIGTGKPEPSSISDAELSRHGKVQRRVEPSLTRFAVEPAAYLLRDGSQKTRTEALLLIAG